MTLTTTMKRFFASRWARRQDIGLKEFVFEVHSVVSDSGPSRQSSNDDRDVNFTVVPERPWQLRPTEKNDDGAHQRSLPFTHRHIPVISSSPSLSFFIHWPWSRGQGISPRWTSSPVVERNTVSFCTAQQLSSNEWITRKKLCVGQINSQFMSCFQHYIWASWEGSAHLFSLLPLRRQIRTTVNSSTLSKAMKTRGIVDGRRSRTED